MSTISDYQEDGSAMGRINAWGVAWEVALHNLFGGGMSYQHDVFFLLYGVHETIVRAAHSIYFQVLGNHGFVGLFLFLGIWFSTYRVAGWLRKNARNQEQTEWAADLGAMVQVSLVGYAVGGAFLSLSYFDLPYNMMILVVAAKAWVSSRGWERDPQVPWLEYIGLRKARPTDSYAHQGIGPARTHQG
jgi:probable O-glycosylation ligase (exosortase A-associated)